MNIARSTFARALVADGPASEYAGKLNLYGQFVGDWVTQARAFLPDGTVEITEWDVRFSWVLEGRAIQDLWITPPRTDASPAWHAPGNRYSTTLRIYDPGTDAWRIVWVNPPNGVVLHQIGRKVGDEIVQLGTLEPDGSQSRWVYRDIGPASFRWCNEHSVDGGKTWKLVQEMLARRIAGPRC